MTTSNILKDRLSPILKWAGGKEQELKYIHPAMPKEFTNYYEPFIGGGAVCFSINANKLFINDVSFLDNKRVAIPKDYAFIETLKTKYPNI